MPTTNRLSCFPPFSVYSGDRADKNLFDGIEQTLKDLDKSMESHWIGPMPPEEFISTLPSDTRSSPEISGIFDSLPQEFADIKDLQILFVSHIPNTMIDDHLYVYLSA